MSCDIEYCAHRFGFCTALYSNVGIVVWVLKMPSVPSRWASKESLAML